VAAGLGSTAPNSAPPRSPLPWYQGAWRADSGAFQLTVQVSQRGEITGSLVNERGSSQLAGTVDSEKEWMRMRALGPVHFGTLVCERKEDRCTGEMRASSEGSIDLNAKPPQLGESWSVELVQLDSALSPRPAALP
jgi:hypothetical protein